MIETVLTIAKDLDYEQFSRMQKSSFKQLLIKQGSSTDFMTPEFFKWKYNPPLGGARIALTKDNGKIVASNSMIPMTVRQGSDSVVAWQSCDTATLPAARRKGYFSSNLAKLSASIGDEEIFFGFPNSNSHLGFSNSGWKPNTTIRFWVNPVASLGWGVGDVRPIGELASFGEEFDSLKKVLLDDDVASIDRTSSYLNWRFIKHPINRYTCFEYRNQSLLSGYIVVREAQLKKRNVAIVMDLWGTDRRTTSALFSQARYWAKERRLNQIVLMDNRVRSIVALIAGFVPVPHAMAPKRQILMGTTASGGVSERIWRSQWHLQMSDWDAL